MSAAQLRATAEKALVEKWRALVRERKQNGGASPYGNGVSDAFRDCARDLEAVLSLTEPANAPCIKTFALGPEGLFGAMGPGKTDGVNANFATPEEAVLALPSVRRHLASLTEPASAAPEPTCAHGRTAAHLYDFCKSICPGPAPGSDSAHEMLVRELTYQADRALTQPERFYSATFAEEMRALLQDAATALRSARPVVAESARCGNSEPHEAHDYYLKCPNMCGDTCPGVAASGTDQRPVVAAVSPTRAAVELAILGKPWADALPAERAQASETALRVRALYAQATEQP